MWPRRAAVPRLGGVGGQSCPVYRLATVTDRKNRLRIRLTCYKKFAKAAT
jgi:hypothetical protein